MRAVLDACVLYPTLLRQILLGAAGAGLYAPLWSERIHEEWRRAVLRHHPEQADLAAAEIASAQGLFPRAMVHPEPQVEAALILPDENDRHVLGCALAGGGSAIVTLNLRDFPGRTLARHGIMPRSPDSLLVELWADSPDRLRRVVETALADLRGAGGGTGESDRALLKRAGLPRLGKALFAPRG